MLILLLQIKWTYVSRLSNDLLFSPVKVTKNVLDFKLSGKDFVGAPLNM